MAVRASAWSTVLRRTSLPRKMKPYLIVLSMSVLHLLTPSPVTTLPLPEDSNQISDNGHRLLRMFSAKLYDQCLQMDTLACLGHKALYSTSRYLQDPGKAIVEDSEVPGREDNVDRILARNMMRYLNASLEHHGEIPWNDVKSSGYSPRGSFFNKKMIFPLLVGVTLKLSSLIPLILGKMTLLGTTSVLSSKMALIIMLMMNMKKWFGGGESSGSHQTLYPHHVPSSLADLTQTISPYSHTGSHDMGDYNHGIPHSGMGSSPYRRRVYIIRSRQLGGDRFWGSQANNAVDKKLKLDSGTDQGTHEKHILVLDGNTTPGSNEAVVRNTNYMQHEQYPSGENININKERHVSTDIKFSSEKKHQIPSGNKMFDRYPASETEFTKHTNQDTVTRGNIPIEIIHKGAVASESINTHAIATSEIKEINDGEEFSEASELDSVPEKNPIINSHLRNTDSEKVTYEYNSLPSQDKRAITEDKFQMNYGLPRNNGDHIKGIRRLDEVADVHRDEQ